MEMDQKMMTIGLLTLVIFPLVVGITFSGYAAPSHAVTGDVSSSCSGGLSPSQISNCVDSILGNFDASDPLGALNILINVELLLTSIGNLISSMIPDEICLTETICIDFGDFQTQFGFIGDSIILIAGAISEVVDTVIEIMSIPQTILDWMFGIANDILSLIQSSVNTLVSWIDGLISERLTAVVDLVSGMFDGLEAWIRRAFGT